MSEPRTRPLHESLRAPLSAGDADRLWLQIEQQRRERAQNRKLVPVIALGCAAAVAAILLVGRGEHTAPRTAQPTAALPAAAASPAPLRWANGAPLSSVEVAQGAPARTLALSDGTRISLASGTRLATRAATHERTELALERGRARFELEPQRARKFEVVSSGLRVEVVGTIFTVERAHDAERVQVAVEHGRVRVHGAGLAQGGVLLEAGRQLAWSAPAAPAGAAELLPDAIGGTAPTSAPSAKAVSERAVPARPAAAATSSTDTEEAAPATPELADDPRALLALADEARAGGRPEQAAAALARLVERYPRSAHAPLAALTLGRLQLDALHDPGAAARSLRRALALGLPKALHEDALARLVQAHADAGDGVAARRAASEYRSRFARGRWRASVDAWSASER